MEEKKKGLGCGSIFLMFLVWLIALPFVAGLDSSDHIDNDAPDISYTTPADETDTTSQTEIEYDTTIPETVETTKATETQPSDDDFKDNKRGRMYNYLNDTEKIIYDELTNAISDGKLEITFKNIDYDEYLEATYKAHDAEYGDHPEFLWFNNGWQASSGFSFNGENITIKSGCYDYWKYTMDKDKYIDATLNAARNLANKAKNLPDDYDKIKYVHNYLVKNVTYDDVCVAEINKTKTKASSQQSHTAYGALVNNLAVCDGYTKAFQLVMNMLDIECEYIDGIATSPHAWNYMNLDGNYYWMDVTWDDLDLEDYPDGVSYSYFNTTDKEFLKSHTPESDLFIPNCLSTHYSFFTKENAYMDTYNFKEFKKIVTNQKDEPIVHVKFKNKNEMQKALDDLFGKNPRFDEIFDSKNIPSYSSDDDTLVISLYLD